MQQLPDALVLIQGHLKQVPLQHPGSSRGPRISLRQLQHRASQPWQQSEDSSSRSGGLQETGCVRGYSWLYLCPLPQQSLGTTGITLVKSTNSLPTLGPTSLT